MRRRKSSIWSIVMLAVVALWFIVDAGADTVRELRLRSGAEKAHAIVLEKDRSAYVRRSWERRLQRAFTNFIFDGSLSEAEYFVTYRLTLPNGTSAAAEAPIGREIWNRLEKGSTLEIEYLASDPDVNRPAGQSALWPALIRLILGAFVALVVVGWTLTLLQERRQSESRSPAAS